MSLVHAIAGAGAGFLIGGPVGAAVGGVVGLLVPQAWDEGQTQYAPGSKVSTSRASTAADVNAVVAQNTASGVSTLLSPDNALSRIDREIDALAATVSPYPDAWVNQARQALAQMTVGLMTTPGHFSVPPSWSAALAAAPGNANQLRATAADAIAALAAMDSAKAKGLAEYLWSAP